MGEQQETLRRGLEEATRLGAKAAEILLYEARGTRIDVLRGKITGQQPVTESRAVVRCWADGGGVGRVEGRPSTLPELVKQAVAATARAPADELAGPVARIQLPAGGLGIDDRRHSALTDDDRVDVVMTAERAARAVDRRVGALDFSYADQRTQRLLANTKGVMLEELSTLYTVSGRVRATDDVGAIELAGGLRGRSFASIASLPYGTTLARTVVALLKPGELPEDDWGVLFPPVIMARVVAALGADLARPDSYLNRERPTLDKRLHVVDDGALSGALRTRMFDDRGVPSVPLTLLREGVVDAPMLDPRGARALDTRATGHVHGDALRCTNLQMRSGTRSMNAILTDRGGSWFKVLHVRDLQVDPASGTLSMVASGQILKGTAIQGAVRDIPLSGPLAEVLTDVEVASDTDRIDHVDAPGVFVRGLTTD